ncbi:MAG: hypothetical protein WBF43_13305, partial [Methylocella sp.]
TIACEPPIFWKFRRSELPSGAIVTHKPEDDDLCHHYIDGLSDKKLRKLVRDRKSEDFRICDGNGCVPASTEKFEKLKKLLAS